MVEYPCLLYRQPHRPDEDRFSYDREDYERSYANLIRRFEGKRLHTIDLGSLVPADQYGLTNDCTPDVFHFQVGGHRMLGAAVDRSAAMMLGEGDGAVQ